MSIGIRVENCKDIKIINCGFSGLETGIDVADSDDVQISGTRFQNVNTGVKARRVKGLISSECTDYSSSAFRLSLVAQVVRLYMEYLKGRG